MTNDGKIAVVHNVYKPIKVYNVVVSNIKFEKLVSKLKSLMSDYFNGSLTIHFSEGNLMKIEIREVTRNL